MVECLLELGKKRTWALELKDGSAEEEGMGEEREFLYPYKDSKISNASPLTLKLAYSQGLYKWHGWITHACIDENPAIRGTRSLL